MPYLTPGFVVKKTFLEIESDYEEETVRRRASDSFIHFRLSTATALYGAAAKRLYADSNGCGVPDLAEESTDAAPTPTSLYDKRDSISSSTAASTSAHEMEDSASSFADEHFSTYWGEVAAEFHIERMRVHNSDDDSDSGENEADESELVAGRPCCFSVGSQLHPEGCGQPCKYAMKRKGCKDGENCAFCHLCTYKQRRDTRRPQRRRAAAAARKRMLAAAAAAQTEAAADCTVKEAAAYGVAAGGVALCEPCQ